MGYAEDYNRYVALLAKTYDRAMGTPLAGLSEDEVAKLKLFQSDAKTSKETSKKAGKDLLSLYAQSDTATKGQMVKQLAGLIKDAQFVLQELEQSRLK